MSIQWFPGHMAKTKRLLTEQLQWVDAVVELADARIPASSRNPVLAELLGNKPRLLLLNKTDLAEEVWTKRWLESLRGQGPAFGISAVSGRGLGRITPELAKLTAERASRLAGKGLRPRPIRVMVVGIPNIGKSSLINQMAGGSKAKTGDKPGITRGNQWIRIHDKIELLDTPGLLWPKFEDPEVGRKLAATGAVRDEVFDAEELAVWLLTWLKENNVRVPPPYESRGQATLEEIGRQRGCLMAGGRVDTGKAAQEFLREFRRGRLGRNTLDRF
ncbi:ribosome biogenesis GTP-binding protein YlqF [Acididesulfobacillus acetoxydans]|uniref:Ribosome biogenesis GTPase A n=1 Tax=Acididesulfobacillus acetoxydans TaxID=1561005 RepID=A0A8S0XCP4_9FIRM|nr:ribosome biogenesis GTPase YlqF [Acididesulfobacillus acetoxydans]CAA7602706.1 ribosome biogenesis GTP-binding protein YlqF [Acididesulfobacillus acetoxydans]CEJ06437.1 Ribosome biogenesis GTPase A [Acididesulfobacillus acetoxydans]